MVNGATRIVPSALAVTELLLSVCDVVAELAEACSVMPVAAKVLARTVSEKTRVVVSAVMSKSNAVSMGAVASAV